MDLDTAILELNKSFITYTFVLNLTKVTTEIISSFNQEIHEIRFHFDNYHHTSRMITSETIIRLVENKMTKNVFLDLLNSLFEQVLKGVTRYD